ncbi:MAG: hypothetical protein AAF557_07020 [Pseudomonadota bacterium]
MKLLKVLALFGILMPALAQSQGVRFDPRGCDPRFCSESGWIFDDNFSKHVTTWRHGLGAVPRSISILFSPDPNKRRVMPVMWSWVHSSTGNPIAIEMGRRAVRLSITNGTPLHGHWTPEEGWKRYREGYWKIIAYR